MLRTSRLLVAGIVSAAAIGAAGSSAAAAPPSEPAVPEPVPSLTPAATEELWTRLVEDPRPQLSSAAECRPLRAVFYAATDWIRLATRLAANPSPCAHYSISVPPLAADKTQLRSGQAEQIRALGPAFHALAEINVTGWTSWVASTGNSWREAGVEARRRMAAAGFDIAAGDTWVVNEFSSAVRQGIGNARANMRAFLQGLHDGDGGPAARGAAFVIGISQPTSDLSLYQARLQDWYEDAAFWTDVSRYVSDWSQELYGDVRLYAAPGASLDARRDALNEYLQHQLALAAAAPAAAEAARAFLGATYNPLANAAWRYDAAFGWTDVPVELMQDYVSAQTYAMRSAGNGRFGYAWSPRNLADLPTTEFTAQTNALLVRLAAAITDSADVPLAACGPTACAGELPGAALTTAWRTFAAWKPSALAITSPPQTLAPGVASAPITIELRTHAGGAYTAGVPVPVELSSSSPTAGFSTGPSGPWTATLTTSIASGASTTSVYFRDLQAGSPSFVAATPGKIAAAQTVTVTAPDTTPPETSVDAGPAGTVASSSASIAFSANESGATFACALDGAAYSSCASPQSYSGLADGNHTFTVQATDPAGNTDPTPAGRTWTIDTVAPQTTMDSGPSGTVDSSSASFSFSASEAGASFACALDGAAYAPCSSPAAYTGLAEGAHVFDVRAVDGAGNVDATPARASWTVHSPPSPAPPPPAPPAPAPSPPPSSGGGGSGAGPDLVVQASATPAAPGVGANVNYTISVRNLGSPASRAHLAVELPEQVGGAVARSDRGSGCTGTTTLSCELDFLSGELVATVRIDAVVREAGSLRLTATASSEPGDVQRANDTATVVTLVAARPPTRPPSRPAPDPLPTLRVVGRTPAAVARDGRAALVAIRFWVSERVRLQARVTPLGSTRPISLLPGTMLAGRRANTPRTTATATVSRGMYTLRARIGTARLTRGRVYLVRLTAVDSAGGRRSLLVRVRA